MQFIQRLRMGGLLSFPPDMDFFELQPLNVLIGPNASGKTNFIEVLELLRATPTDFAAAIRDGGGAAEWLWKGDYQPPIIEVETGPFPVPGHPLRYRLSFYASGPRVDIIDEAVEEVTPQGVEPYFYYTFQQGRPVINIRVRTPDGKQSERTLQWDERSLDQSVLAQRKDPDLYPELYWLGWRFQSIQTFREWTFGRYGSLRWPQRADLPEQWLLPDASNLVLVLNQIEHKSGPIFNEYLKRFFPRFERMSTAISGGTVQFYLHESGFREPIPATRLSDGTIRFIALLATLLAPEPPSLVCIEEPELGLHPDAVALLADLLVEASQRMQLVVTTHSDALVSALTNHPAAIVACERPGAGTVLRRLDPEKLASWLDDYLLGDLWRMGELGANP
ncbi:MAG: AAA family ATPase [Gemmatimonadetes bacterium]|nr:AAA family ATPase [Gemmatimonadota bacterium]